jgi:hypothetical protein
VTTADLDRLRRPALVLAICAGLIVGFDLFILFLNALGFDVSVLNQASTARRFGRAQRVEGLGLRGFPLLAVNSALLLSHTLLLGLALRLRAMPARGLAMITAAWALLPCNCSCLLFPISIWLFVAMQNRASTPT